MIDYLTMWRELLAEINAAKEHIVQGLNSGTFTISGSSIPSGSLVAHAARHQNAGADEISVAGLSGVLADGQTPVNHDHSGDAGDGGTFDAASLTSGAATDGYVLTADGASGAAWEAIPAQTDSAAIHDNVDGEISAVTEKASPVGADVLLIEDSAASYAKKRVQITNLPGGADADAIHDNVASEISAITEKASPVSADMLIIEDSEAANVKKMVQVGNLPGGGAIATDTIWDAVGDTVYGSGANTGAKLAGNTTTTKKFLTQTGDGAASAAPAWDTIVVGDIPNRTRSFFISAMQLGLVGSATLVVSNRIMVCRFADAATRYVGAAFTMPEDYASGALTITLIFTQSNNAAGNVRWEVALKSQAAGQDTSYTGSTAASTTMAANGTAAVIAQGDSTVSFTPTAGVAYYISVARLGTDGADTLTTNADLIGVKISYTADS